MTLKLQKLLTSKELIEIDHVSPDLPSHSCPDPHDEVKDHGLLISTAVLYSTHRSLFSMDRKLTLQTVILSNDYRLWYPKSLILTWPLVFLSSVLCTMSYPTVSGNIQSLLVSWYATFSSRALNSTSRNNRTTTNRGSGSVFWKSIMYLPTVCNPRAKADDTVPTQDGRSVLGKISHELGHITRAWRSGRNSAEAKAIFLILWT